MRMGGDKVQEVVEEKSGVSDIRGAVRPLSRPRATLRSGSKQLFRDIAPLSPPFCACCTQAVINIIYGTILLIFQTLSKVGRLGSPIRDTITLLREQYHTKCNVIVAPFCENPPLLGYRAWR